MAKILVVYDSKTGHTEKMAFAVAKGAEKVRGIEVVVKKVNETSNEDLLNADGIIVGSPTYYGQMSAKIKRLFDRSVKVHGELEGKVGGAFTSSGGIASGAETTILSILQAMLIHGMIVKGNARTEHYGAAAVGSPRDKNIRTCKALGKRVATLVIKLKA